MSRGVQTLIAASIAAGFLGLLVFDQTARTAPQAVFDTGTVGAAASGLAEITAEFPICSTNRRFTCIVDGDTVWFKGQNLRLEAFDTPESHSQICGGATEIALGKQATARLQQLLNSNAFTLETFGMDGTGQRRLATIRIGGRDVGDILIAERLARRWPDGDEWWCR